MGVANYDPKPREIRAEESQTHLCHRCPIKAQETASAGLTGLSLDYTKKGALDDPSQRQGEGASARATWLCICSVVLIYLDLR